MDTLKTYPFLAYSKKTDGVFCAACVLWYTAPVHGTEATYLIKEPLRDWKKIQEKVRKHMNTDYHKSAAISMDMFKKIQDRESEQLSALETITKAHAELVKKNRTILGSIFKCMKLCVERGFARRGHRDAGSIVLGGDDADYIDLGNFKAIVKFCAESGDKIVEEHLLTAAKNATYVSSSAQEDMLRSILKLVQLEVVSECRNQEGKFIFAVSADEVTDVSTTEQLGIVIRTVSKTGTVNERLLEYIDMESIKGAAIAKAIVECLDRHGLSIMDCRAQTYDGAGNMSGYRNGCRAHVENLQPLAEYFHCSSHRLNLALNGTSAVPEFRILMENIKSLGIFFKYSPKRSNVFRSQLPAHIRIKKVRLLCETRWVERHTTMNEIKLLHPYILSTLESMVSSSSEYDTKTITEASGLLRYLQSAPFIAAFVISEHMLGYTKTLSKRLQGSSISVLSAHRSIDDVLEAIRSARSEEEFSKLWADMTVLNDGDELALPRLAGRQTMRANHEADCPESYYRLAYYLPYVDHLIAELETRFQSKSTVIGGFTLVPAALSKLSFDGFKEEVTSFTQKHEADLPSRATLSQELHTWFLKWKGKAISKEMDDVSEVYIEALASGLYPNVSYLLKLLLTIPVTSASVERANSTLKYIKTPLRSTMSQMTLNAMTLGYKHRDLLNTVSVDTMVEDFCRTKNRRLHIKNPLSE